MLLPSTPPRQHIFRHLAEISRSTRGVVLLICDVTTARLITSEGRRLNMLSGHFIWLWVDTGSTLQPPENPVDAHNTTNMRAANLKNSSVSSTTSPSVAPPSNPANTSSRGKPLNRQPSSSAGGRRPRNDDSQGYFREHYSVRNIRSTDNLVSKSSDKSEHRDRRNRAGTVSDKDMNNIKQSFTSAAYGSYVNNLDTGQFRKHQSIFPIVGQERISDQLNLRELGRSSESWRRAVNIEADDNVADHLAEDGRLPLGLLALRTLPLKLDRHLIKSAVRLLADTLHRVLAQCEENDWLPPAEPAHTCWEPHVSNFSTAYARELRIAVRDALAGRGDKVDKPLVATFDVLNLVQFQDQHAASIPQTLQLQDSEDYEGWWRVVGSITGRAVHLDTIVWPGGELMVAGLSPRARSVFRIVTALAPPFVMEGELDEDGQCLRGLPCHRVLTSDKDNLTLVFNELETQERLEEEGEDLGLTLDEDAVLTTKRADTARVPLVHDPDSRQHHHRSGSSSTVTSPYFEQRFKYRTNCCYGLSMDLLENVAHELEFDFHLYIVADGLFGTKTRGEEPVAVAIRQAGGDGGGSGIKPDEPRTGGTIRDGIRRGETGSGGVGGGSAKWNGIVGDLVSGAAHMSFAALSVSSARSEVIDFSVPYFFSGVSFLAAPTQKSEIPLLAFLLPFSPELWIAIFTFLNITAMAVAVYEWLSPFGLNPWGRQRSKNFSIASALWVMWGLLCGHLVAFKAPKSWPNKFLINVWGGFSVIFVASYTANIAALIAGLFFHNAVSNYHDRSLLSQKVGAPRASAADYYVHRANQHLWEHMQKYAVRDVEEGIQHLKNGSLDILIADTPILDYYRATDHGCKLQKIGDAINEDTYAVGMTKGFPLKDSISAVIAKYSSNGYMDILQEKWYGALPCFKLQTDMAQPRPLGVAAVAGVFILLGLGMVLGCLILIFEHLFYRYTLPILRHQPKGTIWRSRNIMFFSQKLYRFINCVELVSPHHAARELVHTIRQGQITSLFQKSVKRKEHEQRRRRKSKAQFFEMIQEIRRVQQEGRDNSNTQEESAERVEGAEVQSAPLKPERRSSKNLLSPSILQPKSAASKTSPRKLGKLRSPRPSEARKFYKEIFSPGGTRRNRSPTSSRRFSTDMILSPLRPRSDCPSSAVGRRLSKDSGGCNSPPDINSRRSSYLDVSAKQDKLSTLDMRFQQGRSHLDVRMPLEARPSGLNLSSTIPRLGSTSNTNISSSNMKHEIGARRMEVSSVQERLNTIGSRLGSLSSCDVSSGPQNLSRSRSKSPIPSMINLSIPSPTEIKPKASPIPRIRERILSDTNAKDAIRNRPKLRTPSPTDIKEDTVQRTNLHSTSRRSHSLENQKTIAQEDEIKPAPPENEGNATQFQKSKRSDFTLPYESIIEVNVTCCDSTPEKTPKDISTTYQSKPRNRDTSTRSQEHINISATSPSPYSSLRKTQFKRRQSHQPRLETVYTPQHQVVSPTSSSQSSTKEFLVPVQRHDNSSSSSSSRSPVRRRHQSHPVRSEATSKQQSAIATSSSIPDMSTARSPSHQKRRHGRHHRDSSHECDEVFDEIPPPPPPPFCPSRNGSNGESPLDRLNKEELVALWRSSESELRSHLLRAIRAKEVNDPP